jgi:ferredoxin-NAD(P)+ reductase (naphthalene dioxygenase ferredoxin-specific)
MSVKVKVRQFGEPLIVEPGETILQSALARGYDYPHSCQAGNCGTCKSRLFSGEIEMSPFSEFARTPAEELAGLFLACRAVPWSDCDVAYLESEELATHPQRKLRCKVSQLSLATHDILNVQLRIESGGPFDFTAGQYATLGFDGLPTREYSMASLPTADHLEFFIRSIPNGTVSSALHARLAVGDRVLVSGPQGIAHWRKAHKGPVLAIAGGSGLAPIKAIVEQSLIHSPDQALTLYFGVRDERDIFLEDYFRGLEARHDRFTFIPVLSEPSGPTRRRTGYLADVLEHDLESVAGVKAYLAGPPIMVESCSRILTRLGLSSADLHMDAFYTEAEKARLRRSA